MENRRQVIVKQLPARLDRQQARAFLRELRPLLERDQPRLVLDLSQVRQLDSSAVDLLLKCLQEAMRRDGDVKLAHVSPECAIVLGLTRTDRLFEIYSDPVEAVESFHAFTPQGSAGHWVTNVSSGPPERDQLKTAS